MDLFKYLRIQDYTIQCLNPPHHLIDQPLCHLKILHRHLLYSANYKSLIYIDISVFCTAKKCSAILEYLSDTIELVNTGTVPFKLENITTIRKAVSNIVPVPKPELLLDKVPLDIGYGSIFSVGEYIYSLMIINRCTTNCYTYGLKLLPSDSIIQAYKAFHHAVEHILPETIY